MFEDRTAAALRLAERLKGYRVAAWRGNYSSVAFFLP